MKEAKQERGREARNRDETYNDSCGKKDKLDTAPL
jgi:hypothetical protein